MKTMTDIQLRGIVLSHLYDKRRDHDHLPDPADFTPPLKEADLISICDQLMQHRLVDANIQDVISGERFLVYCRISARGIDVVETGSSPDLRIDLMAGQNITISGSSNVIVGNHNQQSVHDSVQELVRIIESSTASTAEKEQAKGLLRQVLEHPLFASVAGTALTLLSGT